MLSKALTLWVTPQTGSDDYVSLQLVAREFIRAASLQGVGDAGRQEAEHKFLDMLAHFARAQQRCVVESFFCETVPAGVVHTARRNCRRVEVDDRLDVVRYAAPSAVWLTDVLLEAESLGASAIDLLPADERRRCTRELFSVIAELLATAARGTHGRSGRSSPSRGGASATARQAQ